MHVRVFPLFFFLLFLFLQTSRQGSLNRDVIFKMSFRKACFRFINDPTIHLRLRKGNKNTVFNNLRGRVTRKVCLTSWRDFSDYAISRLLFPFFFFFFFFFFLICPVTNIRRNVYENSNLAGFHGRARIVSRREKALKTSPRSFICSERFKDGDIILVMKWVYAWNVFMRV